MLMTTLVRGLCFTALVAVGACESLDIENPNAPDAERALSDPSAIEAVAGGSVRVWFNTYEGLEGVGPLVTQAQSYSSSWNNFNMNFYSSIDGDGTRNTRAWQNNPAQAGRTSIEHFWEGYYSSLALATNVVRAIKLNGLVINNETDTRRTLAVGLLMQGAALSGIATNYDKGYIIDENTDLGALGYSNRKEVRDAAVAKFDSVIALVASGGPFVTPASWFNGNAYSSSQISRMASTMAAMTLAYWPRNATENTAVDWPRVVSYAENGISSGTPFDVVVNGDGCSSWCHEVLNWFNAISYGRVHTRVATMMDPSQQNPWPLSGNPQPNSPDNRMGDGTFGSAAIAAGMGTVPEDATTNPGTDFAWSANAIYNMARGSYHQSNIAHIRYDISRNQDENFIWGGRGPAPLITRHQNDLIWAEGLVRSAGDLNLAATLINNTRVTRGGLTPATAGGGVSTLLAQLEYENEIELLGLGAAPFYFRRRIGGLIPGTPHEMPVPAKELGVFNQPLYTWGGTGAASSPTPP